MKKEFAEAVVQGGGAGGVQALQGGMAPNIKGGSLTTAIMAAAGPAVEVVKMLDASGGAAGCSVIREDAVPVNENDHLKTNEISGGNAGVTMRKISAQMASTMGLGGHAQCIDYPCDEGKGVVDADRDMEDYMPNFQRVSVSGDDNTGVS